MASRVQGNRFVNQEPERREDDKNSSDSRFAARTVDSKRIPAGSNTATTSSGMNITPPPSNNPRVAQAANARFLREESHTPTQSSTFTANHRIQAGQRD